MAHLNVAVKWHKRVSQKTSAALQRSNKTSRVQNERCRCQKAIQCYAGGDLDKE